MFAGMIYGSRSGSACPGCGRPSRSADLTCPRCGAILDEYQFRQITAKSLSGGAQEVFHEGEQACRRRWKEARSLEVEASQYQPVPGQETAYRAGWQHATDQIEGRRERARGRLRGLAILLLGVVLTALIPTMIQSLASHSVGIHGGRLEVAVILGAPFCVIGGLYCLITGRGGW